MRAAAPQGDPAGGASAESGPQDDVAVLVRRLVDDEEFKVTRDGSTVGTIDYLSP